MSQLDATPRSALLNKKAQFVGFMFVPHILQPQSKFMNLTVFKMGDVYVICMTEGDGVGDPLLQSMQLGQIVDSSTFAASAQRNIDTRGKAGYKEVTGIINEFGKPYNKTLTWLDEAKLVEV